MTTSKRCHPWVYRNRDLMGQECYAGAFELITDGGSRGNPGRGGCAWIIKGVRRDGEKLLRQGVVVFGECTNNQAEYAGLYFGLEDLKKFWNGERVTHITDSQLLSKQITGEWKCKDKILNQLNVIIRVSNDFAIRHLRVPREDYRIRQVDQLCNQGMDSRQGSVLSYDNVLGSFLATSKMFGKTGQNLSSRAKLRFPLSGDKKKGARGE